MKNDFQMYFVQTTMFSLNASDKHVVSNNFLKMKLFFQYSDFAKVFNEKTANILFEHDSQNLAINTQDINSSFESFYNISKKELKMFKKYLDKHLKNDFITSFKSTCAASILFIKKKTSDLRLCVDYRKLNAIIVKNRYSFLFISETFDHIVDVKYFIKLDIIATYNKLRIKKKDE
jgi:sugar-specific transcriptional regulator TrmB